MRGFREYVCNAAKDNADIADKLRIIQSDLGDLAADVEANAQAITYLAEQLPETPDESISEDRIGGDSDGN